MLDVKDFSFFENENPFDFKGFVLKVLSYFLKVPLHNHMLDLEAYQSYQLLHNSYS